MLFFLYLLLFHNTQTENHDIMLQYARWDWGEINFSYIWVADVQIRASHLESLWDWQRRLALLGCNISQVKLDNFSKSDVSRSTYFIPLSLKGI